MTGLPGEIIQAALSIEPELDVTGRAGSGVEAETPFNFEKALTKIGLSRKQVANSVNRATLMKSHWRDVFDLTNGSHLALMLKLEEHIQRDLDAIQRGDFASEEVEIATRNSVSRNAAVYQSLGQSISKSLIASVEAELKVKKFKAASSDTKRSKKPGFGAVHIQTNTLNLVGDNDSLRGNMTDGSIQQL